MRFTGTIAPPEPGTYRFQLERRRCDAKAELERYTIRIEGAAPVNVNELCSARDAAGSANAVEVRFDDTKPRPFVIEYSHRHKTPGSAPALTLVWKTPDGALQREAVRTARQADVIVAFVGLNAWLEGEEMDVKVPGFAGGDRTDIALPRPQAELVKALEATGKPVVVVLQSGSAVALGPAKSANAVLDAWYGGEQGGRAIADVLSGSYNPAGRLPVTFYASDRRASRLHRLCNEGPHLPLLHRQAGISVRLRAELHELPLFRADGIALGGGPHCVGASVKQRAAQRRRGRPALCQAAASGGVPLRSLKGFARVPSPRVRRVPSASA